MKRTLFKSSSLKITSAIALTAVLGGAAFAGPDNPKKETEDAKTHSERVVVEESTTIDATVMPNDANAAETKTAEDTVANWSLETEEEVVIELPEAELEALKAEDDTLVIDSPDTVIVSNPDEIVEIEDNTAQPEN